MQKALGEERKVEKEEEGGKEERKRKGSSRQGAYGALSGMFMNEVLFQISSRITKFSNIDVPVNFARRTYLDFYRRGSEDHSSPTRAS